ncbi:thioredoxin family protein [bacterium]|nr:thioredoxin family protein [bacterium]
MNRNALMIVLLAVSAIWSCGRNDANAFADKSKATGDKTKVTFVELGSVNCIPCKAMQPVMKAIEEKYGDQIKVVFYDVWKADQKKYAQEYNIRLIPTQVFLDSEGKEFFRHEGFFPEEEIDQLLHSRGLKPVKKESKS